MSNKIYNFLIKKQEGIQIQKNKNKYISFSLLLFLLILISNQIKIIQTLIKENKEKEVKKTEEENNLNYTYIKNNIENINLSENKLLEELENYQKEFSILINNKKILDEEILLNLRNKITNENLKNEENTKEEIEEENTEEEIKTFGNFNRDIIINAIKSFKENKNNTNKNKNL